MSSGEHRPIQESPGRSGGFSKRAIFSRDNSAFTDETSTTDSVPAASYTSQLIHLSFLAFPNTDLAGFRPSARLAKRMYMIHAILSSVRRRASSFCGATEELEDESNKAGCVTAEPLDEKELSGVMIFSAFSTSPCKTSMNLANVACTSALFLAAS